MRDKLIHFLKRPTSKDVIINTLGNYLGVFFSAFFVYLLVRVLSPAEYGIFSVLFGVAYVLTPVLEFGTTATIYSYLPNLVHTNNPIKYRLIKSIFFYQSFFAIIIVAVLCAVFPTLDLYFFKTNVPTWELWIVAISVLFFIWQNFLINIMLVTKKVVQMNIYSNISNVIKTLIIIALWLSGYLTLGSLFITFGIVGPVIFYFFVYTYNKKHIYPIMNAPVVKDDVRLKYTLTYFIASQFNNFGLRIDLFLLSYYRSKNEVGFYGLAQKIILTIIGTIVSITQVISPSFSAIKAKRDIFPHVKSGIFYMLVPTGLFLLLAVLPDWVFTLFFTEKFIPALVITRKLSYSFVLLPFINLLNLFILYTVKKPGYILVANIILFIIIASGSYVYIPLYGYMAPIISIFVAFIFSAIFLFSVSVYEYRRMK
ncbi:hypothetical protein COY87_03570 [Candidatus Roizmanbacteria bacterium CG_4_10_14_0_8_um_filter_33_9]|uniref:Polysaccharide biosynthesis protein C-terminal domain-containing protein n=1 Tax=Candidatus Roizmanbacteria bacterium CG_4_10_14_0_8_um_filter_33_9 TaxID=1974826 RepID=A0A2M7QHY3_9BACT|nr:MAG: hypothetical protein COY87_03570 [Candidatus Roizmanbacteria bacterium CG_4_10_14_0_8_um_filter_33_9]